MPAPTFPFIYIDLSALDGQPAYMVMSKVTKIMWRKGISEHDMLAFCSDIAGKPAREAVATSRRWVSVVDR